MNLNIFLIIFASVLILLFVFFVIFLFLSLKKTASKIDEMKRSQSEDKALSLMQQQIGQLTQNINKQLQNMSTQLQKTTGNIGSTLGDVKKDLGKMEEVTREVLEHLLSRFATYLGDRPGHGPDDRRVRCVPSIQRATGF